ncbi:urate oxidase [Halobacillus salinarum]|uniref:Uricase n=1 Tax=Halobacillus salinarum TaxID=2932257 RepID=A0ABY4EGX9_9BACI|nr:urate oxidase [Halobacillus salinarum]UOQ43695.1 urate oxidase [Halobacillus salinarum]
MDKEREMFYGKRDVFAYRTYLKPLKDVRRIEESDFNGKSNVVFGINVSVKVGGEQFLPSFTQGDNSMVVATDSMKNFIQKHLGSYEGCTIEGFLAYTAQAFLNKYSHFESVEMKGEEIPFESARALTSTRLTESDVVFKHSRNETVAASCHYIRKEEKILLKSQQSSLYDLQLIKVSGNSFVGYIQDEYTTLPEDGNRPLFIYLNIHWQYHDKKLAYGEEAESYVAAEQVKDIAACVFHEQSTPSIQNLIYHIGLRILARFPQLKDVTFESQNRTWETVVGEIPGSAGKVYTEPRPPYGFQVFTVTHEDLVHHEGSALESHSTY